MDRRIIYALVAFTLITIFLVPYLRTTPIPPFPPTKPPPPTSPPMPPTSDEMPPQKAKAIIIGTGLAGLSAASELIASSIPVIMLERYARPGGNSMKASSGINGAGTRFQRVDAEGRGDGSFEGDTVRSAGCVFDVNGKEGAGSDGDKDTKRRRELITVLTSESKSAIDWLSDKHGIDLSLVTLMGGHSFPRTHRGSGKTPPGASIVLTLLEHLKKSPIFTLLTECVVTKVLVDEGGATVGVEYTTSLTTPSTDTTLAGTHIPIPPKDDGKENKATETKHLFGPLIFATGGFAGDSSPTGYLSTYRPDLLSFPSTNTLRPGSQHLLTSIGARLIDMEYVQIHPTSFVDPQDSGARVKFLAAECLRGEGGVLVSAGKRFVGELGMRKEVVGAILGSEREKGEDEVLQQYPILLILTPSTYLQVKPHVDFYISRGLMHRTTLGTLLPQHPGLLSTLRKYSASVTAGVDEEFHRKDFGHWGWKEGDVTSESEVYVGRVTPALHFTMGGVVIDSGARVLRGGGDRVEDEPILGLWAAGEVTGGVHGENRLGGSSLLECVVFGRRAGKGVVEFLKGS